MKYYTVEQVAEMFNVAESTVFNRLRAKKYPHAQKNGKWAIPECCVAPGSTCLAGGDGSLPEALELAKMQAETAKNDAEAAHATSKVKRDEALGLRDLPETLTALEGAVAEAERVLESRIVTSNQRIEELQGKEDKLNSRERALNKVLEEIKGWRGDCAKDLEKLRKYYNKLCDHCREYKMPTLKELTLPEGVYTSESPITAERIISSNQFDEGGEENVEDM